jgi:microcystin-dependent protein
MSEPFLSEIKMFGFNFAPRGWASCQGQILPINQNQSLYSLLGTTYGGDGRTSFALPDLRSRSPREKGNSTTLGQKGGQENVVLTAANLPAHSHRLHVNTSGSDATTPEGNFMGKDVEPQIYHPPAAANTVDMTVDTVGSTGGSQGHSNMQPYQAINFCIALQGLFPSRN